MILTPFSEEHPRSLSLLNSPSVSPETRLSTLIWGKVPPTALSQPQATISGQDGDVPLFSCLERASTWPETTKTRVRLWNLWQWLTAKRWPICISTHIHFFSRCLHFIPRQEFWRDENTLKAILKAAGHRRSKSRSSRAYLSGEGGSGGGAPSRVAPFLSVTPPPGTCDARQKKDGYGRLVWIPIGSSSISVAYGNGYVMIPSYSLSAPVSLYNNTIIQQPPSLNSLLPTPKWCGPMKSGPNLIAAPFCCFSGCPDSTYATTQGLFPRRLIKPDVILSMT